MEPGRRATQGRRSLVLNADGEPIHICDAGRALVLVLHGKAETVVDSDIIVHSLHDEFYLPSVIVLHRYVKVPHGRSIPLTRRTVVARDRGRCGYCGNTRAATTMDHVIPKAQGGPHTWENVIAACQPCNHKKADKTPEQAKMPLLFQPTRPRGAHARLLLFAMDEAWEPYLLERAA